MTPSQLSRTIYLTMAVFALQPMVFGVWLALIPVVKANLDLTKGELALALLGNPLALIPSLQIASRMITRFGPRRLLAVFFPIQTAALLLPLMAQSQMQLFFALAVFGVAMAFMQVCLNVYAGRLEKGEGAAVMNRCHGFWALGLMAGPLLLTAMGDVHGATAILIVGSVTTVLGIWVSLSLPHLGDAPGQVAPPRRALRALPPPLIYIAVFALAVALVEGAMSDWAAIYLAERLPDGSRLAGLGVSVYAGCLAAGRLAGDWLKVQLGAVRLAQLTVGMAIVGVLCLVLPLPLSMAFVGFALIGFGASVGFPLGVSAVAALDDRYEGANIAIMSMVSICGFLIGPPLIGFLADAFSLRVGLAALLPGLCAGIVLARWLRPA